jgi:hypothetical protein
MVNRDHMTPSEKRADTKRRHALGRIAQQTRYREVSAIVATGVCPLCGWPVKRNLALTGWYQCSQYGADGFRADSTKPQCSWQGFTE